MGGKIIAFQCLSYMRYVVCLNVHCYTFPGGSDGKASACNVGDPGLTAGLGRSLEKEMTTHSSILAWRVPWMEEPGGLQSMGLKS